MSSASSPVKHRYFRLGGELKELAEKHKKAEKAFAKAAHEIAQEYGADAWTLRGDTVHRLLIFKDKKLPEGMQYAKEACSDPLYCGITLKDPSARAKLAHRLKKLVYPEPVELIVAIEKRIKRDINGALVRGSNGMNYMFHLDYVTYQGEYYAAIVDTSRTPRLGKKPDRKFKAPADEMIEITYGQFADITDAIDQEYQAGQAKAARKAKKAQEKTNAAAV